MTDAEIDALDGLALRKAVAEAVGWEWHEGHLRCSCPHQIMAEHAVGGGVIRFLHRSNWNDAIAACESAGMRDDYVWNIYANYVHIRSMSKKAFCGMGKGSGPEALCRALLQCVEARRREDGK